MTNHKSISKLKLEESAMKLDSPVKILVLMELTVMSLSMFMLKMLILPQVYMVIKMKKIWVLEIKDWCSDMPLTNGTVKYYIHILMYYLTKFVNWWQRRERMVKSHGWDQIANLKLLLNIKNLKRVMLNQLEYIISLSQPNMLQKLIMRLLEKYWLKMLLML